MGWLWINDSYSLLVLMNCSIRAFNLLIMFLSVTQLLAVMPASNRLTAMILQISLRRLTRFSSKEKSFSHNRLEKKDRARRMQAE